MTKLSPKRKVRAKSEEVVVPDKLYFRIGEVSKLSSLPAYVLRFWETEFSQLKPTKSGTGQRMYRRRDVENILLIKKLLYEEGYTIAGARDRLKTETKPARAQVALPFIAAASNQEGLKRLRYELQDLLKVLSSSPRAKR